MTDKPRVREVDGRYYPAHMVSDSLENVVAGIGTQQDKRSHNQFTYGLPSTNWVELEGAYVNNWIARQIINVPVDDAFRGWRKFNVDDQTAIEAEEKRLDVKSKFTLGEYWGRLYGGAVIVMLTDQDLSEELDPKKIKKGSLKRLVVLDRWDIHPFHMNFTNPIAPNYLMPEMYHVVSGTQLIHSSHVIRIDGEPLPRRMRALNEGWGDSTLRKVLSDLKDVVATKEGIASLVLEANVDTVQREGLSHELASDQEDQILKRFALASQMKSMINMMLLDGDETYERKEVSFGGLAQIMNEFMTWISGAADIPATRLFGTAPKGMNATGEGDMDNYYNSVESFRQKDVTPQLEKLDEVMVRSALGDMPEDYQFEWEPLYQESGTELAQRDLATAQTEEIQLSQGVIKPSHIMQRIKQDNRYALTEEDIDKQQQKEKEEELFEQQEGSVGDPNFGEPPEGQVEEE